MTATTRLYTRFFGQFVGQDTFGNRYFREKKLVKGRRDKRWVIYHGTPEPSKVPAEWHGWLHHTTDIPPTEQPMAHHRWQKPHLPNLTGTTGAYMPSGHVLSGEERFKPIAEYDAWKP